MDNLETVEAIKDRLVTLGVRNIWYPVAASWMVGTAPVGITRLGERLVLWRDEDGAVHALEDRCPHRGARLSLGWNLGDRIACWYHGVEVDTSGCAVTVPAAERCAFEGKNVVKTYSVQEIRGGIFVYFGDELNEAPAPLELPDELTDDENFDSFLCTATWQCNYQYAIDNVMDPMHGAYLHAQSHSMAQGAKKAKLMARKTNAGFVFEKEGQRDVNFDWVEFGFTGIPWLRLEIPYPETGGPGGNFGIVGFVTPIDESTCQVYFWRTRKVKGWQRDVWRFLYKNRLEGRHWAVLEQDREVLESMSGDARTHENLYEHDGGLTRLRKFMENIAEDQAHALTTQQAAEWTIRRV